MPTKKKKSLAAKRKAYHGAVKHSTQWSQGPIETSLRRPSVELPRRQTYVEPERKHDEPDLSYVPGDLIRIAVLTAIIIVLLVVLALVFR